MKGHGRPEDLGSREAASEQGRRVLSLAKSPNSCLGHRARIRKAGPVVTRRDAMSERFVGIDVSKDTLDIAVRPEEEHWQTANTEEAFPELITRLEALEPVLIVIEATGGLERAVVAAMAAADLPVAMINPRQSREFAKATGRLAKTDEIDATDLAFFGEAIRPEVRSLPDAAVQTLSALNARRQQLLQMLTAERNRLGTALPPARPSLREHIRWLERELERVDSELRRCIDQNPPLRSKFTLLCSVKGVGPATSFALLSNLPELGTVNRKEIAALAGVAPFNRDSGRWRGKRTTWGGRAAVKSKLYMAALTASRHNPVIRTLYERLIDAGKPKKVALTACMHKLIVILNAMVKNGTLWDPNYTTSMP